MGKIFSVRIELWINALLACAWLILCTAASAAAADRCDTWVAKAVSVQGTVEYQAFGTSGWQPVQLDDTFCAGDTIRALENSRADFLLANEAVMRLNAGSLFALPELKEPRTSILEVIKGAMHFFSRRPRSLEIRTPTVVAGVRGTEFFLQTDEEQTFLSIFQGAVLAANEAGELTLTSGQSAVVAKGRAPEIRVVVNPRDAVQWAVYYPPVISDAIPADLLKRDPATIREPALLVQRASLLLDTGEVEEAAANLERALALDPNSSAAYSLQTIIAIARNQKDRAMELAQKAVELAPNSATARIALSYAQQARFNLEGARKSLEEAVALEPENGLAWARLAEIQTGFGELDKALESARRAAELEPDLSRTLTVLGYVYSMQVKIDPAKQAFRKAIRLEPDDPLPRLGLGLAKIREGDLNEGRREIEIAASLDPNSSIIRSYLGKAYYEEKRTELDDIEYQIAKALDPKDPTPYFYDAINKQTENRPVEAMENYQKAIDLNDNRAVYRSTLQLDSDLAARSTSIARIYNELGFGQLGLVTAFNSVNTDPTSYAAHRFLSDTYATLPRHEIARVSELLQSQLLQPLNINPIQPGLAESNFFLISSQGAAQPSFNEFNNLMITRNRAALQASGLAGSNDTWAGEGIVSGIYDKLSLSAGYNHFETDGWRTNADRENEISNIFVQWQFTFKTSFQAEYRSRDSEFGDSELRFFPESFFPNERTTEETDALRFGFRHALTPNTNLIGNFQYVDHQSMLTDQLDNQSLQIDTDQNAWNGELSYLFRSQTVNFVTGGGYFDIDGDEVETEITAVPPQFIPPPPFFPPGTPPIFVPGETETTVDAFIRDTEHANVYLYTYVKPSHNAVLTLGASGDFFDTDSSEVEDQNQFNPKFGITWYPFDGTTVRAAAFRVLKRTLITDQTLEPTQVAGFNQFFDDADATESWRYGAAVDQKLTLRLNAGLELSKRDLKVPFRTTTGVFDSVDWEEYLGRAYVYWTPCDWMSMHAEYLYEKFEREETFAAGLKEAMTHRVPIGINLFHPSGINLGVIGTYYHQEGEFLNLADLAAGFTPAEDSFWLIDATVSYRLPKRYGFVSFGVANLFDEEFRYFDTDVRDPSIQPDRFIFGKITLALP